jgi:hypothetical protein
MSVLWLTCPVVIDPDDGIRKPKVSTLADPGRPPVIDHDEAGNPVLTNKTYMGSWVIDSENWSLCRLIGVDITPILIDSEIVVLYNMASGGLDQPFSSKSEASNRNVDIGDLGQNDEMYKYLLKFGQKIRSDFTETFGTWTKDIS